ncbi:hypothetical protein P12x_001128 [Tundrisphaera lichenicola]|uniref:hypothetical protein n=1 Tax=Tundrisphaera lichenicola TaxID=2029860 RepID=UPI003EBCBC88
MQRRDPSGKNWQRIKRIGRADWYGEREALARVARREISTGINLDDELLDAIENVVALFPNVTVLAGFRRAARPDDMDVRIYLLRRATMLPRRSIAQALGTNPERIHRGIIRGKKLMDRALLDGRLNELELAQ